MTSVDANQLLVVAGEVSGDLHAANLVDRLLILNPGLQVFGIAGDRLLEAGVEPVAHIRELAHMGLAEVVRELPRLRALMRRVADEAGRREPGVALLVDSPDFNLRLARRLRATGARVVLYVSPQLWAWRRGRVRTVRRVANEVLCILPFEVELYQRHGVPARYVGHPLLDDLAREGLAPAPKRERSATHRLALMPGSRTMEVRSLLPEMLNAATDLVESGMFQEVALIEAPGVTEAVDEVLCEASRAPSCLHRATGPGRRHQLAGSSVAWTASGTATLECALLDVPMVVGYRLQRVTYHLARLLVRVEHVALANLIAGQRAAPELIQSAWTSANLILESERLLAGGDHAQRHVLATVRQRLGSPGASERAARAVLEHMRSS